MDTFLNKAGSYTDLHSLPFYTDTDSLIMHKSVYDNHLKEYYKPGQLGYLDFDIGGKIVTYYGVCPKVYFVEYVDKNGEIKKHVRSKGISYKSQNLLTKEDYHKMVHDPDYTIKITTNLDQGRVIQCDKQLKRLNFKLNSTNIKDDRGIFTLYESDFERTLNVTKFQKRKVLDDRFMSTVPFV
jgi:hypothetical protein